MVITKKAIENEIYKEKVSWILTKLNIPVQDISLYILAFIHRSLVNERNDFAPEHNERLEFLWDAVLELVITRELYLHFPEKQEGELTDYRSALVRGKNLASVAKELSFSEYLLLGKWEEKSGWRHKDYILANTVEAFIGAIYLDCGLEIAQKFILDYIYSTLSKILDEKLFKDYKTLLQEFTQAKFDITPHYSVHSEQGPDHEKLFEIWVYLWEKCIGIGIWSSKKKWQESAAENAYNTLTSEI